MVGSSAILRWARRPTITQARPAHGSRLRGRAAHMLGAEAEPTSRAGMRAATAEVEQPHRPGRGDRLSEPRTRSRTRSCTATWMAWISRGAGCGAACTASKSASVSPARCAAVRPGCWRRRTASWIARLMPTPPIGDIAWAHPRCTRAPVATSAGGGPPHRQAASHHPTRAALRRRSAQERRDADDLIAEELDPRVADASNPPLRITKAHCQ